MASLAFKGTFAGNEYRTILAATRALAERRFADLLAHQRATREAGIYAIRNSRSSLARDSIHTVDDDTGNRSICNDSRDRTERFEVNIQTFGFKLSVNRSTFAAIKA